MDTAASIVCSNVYKTFRQVQKEPGIAGSIRSFFRRRYATIAAVEDLSYAIHAGEIVGLLGPNGAGKTTLMKLCTGIIAPSAGSITVLGHTPFDRPLDLRRRIALVMGQKSQLWWDVPAMDTFLLLQSYYQVAEVDFRQRLSELSELLGVERLLRVPTRKLSLGERMKMELIACLLHRPEVLFLDEPTIGLDIVSQETVRDFLLRYHKLYKPTIVLTSHYMADVAALCSRIILILSGKKHFDGPLSKFETILGRERLLTLLFAVAPPRTAACFNDLQPLWGPQDLSVEIRVPEESFASRLGQICAETQLIDIRSDELPIERVMSTLLKQVVRK